MRARTARPALPPTRPRVAATTLLGVVLPALALAAATAASGAGTRVETLRWAHPNPAKVAGFRVHVGSASRQYDQVLDVGRPPASAGVFTYDLTVPDTADVYVAVSAYAPGGAASPYSNEQLRAAPGGGSGGGTGGTGGSGSTGGSTGGSGGDDSGSGDDFSPPGADLPPLGAPGRPTVISD